MEIGRGLGMIADILLNLGRENIFLDLIALLYLTVAAIFGSRCRGIEGTDWV